MRVAIVEPHYHASYLHAVIRIAQACQIESHVFTVPTVWNETKKFFSHPLESPLIICAAIKDLLTEIYKHSSEFDCILFNTVQILEWQNLVRLAYRIWRCPTVFTIHNPRYWFEHPGYQLSRPRARLRLHCRNRVLKSFDGIIFLGDKMIEYAHANGYTNPIGLLPYGVFDGFAKNARGDNGRTIFAVSGSISENRDYDSLLNVFERVFSRHGNGVALWLVGGVQTPYGKAIISRCRRMIRNGSDIVYYPHNYISERILQTHLPRADYMIVPVSETIFGDNLKVSGTIYDAIRYKIPFLIPDFYNLPKHINGGFLRYRSERDLESVVEQCISSNKEIDGTLKREAERNANNYRPDSWKQSFEAFLFSVVS